MLESAAGAEIRWETPARFMLWEVRVAAARAA
jgi:hypothetical protein